MSQRIIEVIPYQAVWAEQFAHEKAQLEQALTGLKTCIHHIGSTAVPGLSAKPIIDILLECESLSQLDSYNAQMESLGYLPKGEFGIPRRRYFQKGGDARSHHLHAFVFGDPHVVRHLAFRDYLIAHPSIANAYAQLKQQGAEWANHDSEKYCDYKNDFVQEHERKAMAWVGEC